MGRPRTTTTIQYNGSLHHLKSDSPHNMASASRLWEELERTPPIQIRPATQEEKERALSLLRQDDRSYLRKRSAL